MRSLLARNASTKTRRAAVLLPSLRADDATANDAVAMASLLREDGWEARLFAGSWSTQFDAAGLGPARRFLERPGAVAIYHCGARWDEGMELLEQTRAPVFVRDHNVTPARFFEGISDEFVDAAAQGLAQRRTLAQNREIHRFLAVSPRNAGELRDLGAPAERVTVVPPLHRAEELARTPPDYATLRQWQNRPAGLFVGRIAPHKGHRRLLRISAIYRELFGHPLPLRLVGSADPRLRRWTALVESDRDRLGLGDSVQFCGPLSFATLKSAYLTASLFLCCSEHEGFCIPLVEAAWLGVPIVAVSEAGVATTLDGAHLLLEDASDELIATCVRRVLHDRKIHEELVAAQSKSVASRYSSETLRSSLYESLAEI